MRHPSRMRQFGFDTADLAHAKFVPGAWREISSDNSDLQYVSSSLSGVGSADAVRAKLENYLEFVKLSPDVAGQAMVDLALRNPAVQLLLSHYADRIPPLPDDPFSFSGQYVEQLRGRFGSARAEAIHRITQANLLGVNADFKQALQSSGASTGEQIAAFTRQYLNQDTVASQLFAATYGQNLQVRPMFRTIDAVFLGDMRITVRDGISAFGEQEPTERTTATTGRGFGATSHIPT